MMGWGTTLLLVVRIAFRWNDGEILRALLCGIAVWLIVEAPFSACLRDLVQCRRGYRSPESVQHPFDEDASLNAERITMTPVRASPTPLDGVRKTITQALANHLKLMDMRVQKEPKPYGLSWVMITRLPLAWGWASNDAAIKPLIGVAFSIHAPSEINLSLTILPSYRD
jgi:hypothetical protein